MSLQRVTMLLEIDDELLAEHVRVKGGERPPYTTSVGEWDASDVFRAADEGIVDPGESELVVVELVRAGAADE
jgi:hypothetical protein